MPATSSRTARGGSAAARRNHSRTKQRQYIIDSSSDEDASEEKSFGDNSSRSSNDDGGKNKKGQASSSKVGGVLASLNNQLPRSKKKKPLSASARKKAKGPNRRSTNVAGLNENDGDSPNPSTGVNQASSRTTKKANCPDDKPTSKCVQTPEPKKQVGPGRLTGATPPPTSVVIKHGLKNRSLSDEMMSPPTSENRRAYNRRVQKQQQQRKNATRQRRQFEEEISAMSDEDHDEDDEDSVSEELSSSSEASSSADETSRLSQEDEEDVDHEEESSASSGHGSNESSSSENEVDKDIKQEEDEEENVESDAESESNEDDESDEEFEFEDDEFVPEEEDCDEDDSDGSLGDFIVDETPRKSARLSARKAKKNTSTNRAEDNKENAKHQSPIEEECSSVLNEEQQEENVEKIPEYFKKMHQSPVGDCSPIVREEQAEDVVENSPKEQNTTSDKRRHSHGTEQHSTSTPEAFVDDNDNDPPLFSPEISPTTADCDETLIEETPMKNSLPRRALNFQSPEAEVTVVVVDDDENSSMEVDCVAVVVDEDDNEFDDEDNEVDEELSVDVSSASVEDSISTSCVEDPQNSSPSKALEIQTNSTSIDEKCNVDDKPEISETPNDGRSRGETVVNTSDCTGDLRERWLNLQLASPASQFPQEATNEELVSATAAINTTNKQPTLDVEAKSMKDIEPIKVAQPKIDRSYRADGTVKRGHWTLGAKIGVGSFGEVFVGMNTKNGTLMAVKKFYMEGAVKADIRREIELLRSLKHENIVRYLGAEMDSKTLHIFQEWVPGGSVSSLLSKFGSFSLEVIQSYLSQTLAGLAYLHQNNIMHRDIKGSNVLVNDYGVVKLADFGASKKLANLEDNLMMSMTVRGSPYFMAPEVFEEKYSAKADVWSVGGLAFQMTTGMPPWKEKGFTNPISLFNHIKRQTGPPRMEHPGSPSFTSRQKTMWHMLEELVRKCFDQDSDKRPTVKQVQDDPFFLSIHDCDDDQTQCLGLFSPRSGGLTLGSPSSPKMMSPTIASPPLRSAEKQWRKASPAASSTSKAAAPLSRSKSLVQWKSTFVSPPRQKTRSSPNPARKSPAPRSPAPNTSEWPEWARKELKKQQHQRLPMQTPHKEVQDLQTLMDSLALSEGTNSFQAQNSLNKKLASAGTTISTSMNKSQLIGLAVLENEEDEENQSKDTYEI